MNNDWPDKTQQPTVKPVKPVKTQNIHKCYTTTLMLHNNSDELFVCFSLRTKGLLGFEHEICSKHD